jgi:hypothetical protein
MVIDGWRNTGKEKVGKTPREKGVEETKGARQGVRHITGKRKRE